MPSLPDANISSFSQTCALPLQQTIHTITLQREKSQSLSTETGDEKRTEPEPNEPNLNSHFGKNQTN